MLNNDMVQGEVPTGRKSHGHVSELNSKGHCGKSIWKIPCWHTIESNRRLPSVGDEELAS